uniref:Uncharacterized protein n=1 Tax=Trichuris muris TaxID=70415 RepID=A0A5S6Q355_TRIMR
MGATKWQRIAALVPARLLRRVTFCSDGPVSAGANRFIGAFTTSTNLLAANILQRYRMQGTIQKTGKPEYHHIENMKPVMKHPTSEGVNSP